MGKLFAGLGVVAVAAFAVAMFFTGSASVEYGWASMPAEMDGVVHVDMQSLTATPFFDEFMKRAEEKKSQNAKLDEFAERTGFDLQHDLHSITFGGLGDPEETASSVYAIVRGNFDRERWFDYIGEQAAIEREQRDGIETWSVVHDDLDKGPSHTRVAWVEDGVAIVSLDEHYELMRAAFAGDAPRLGDTPLGDRFASLDGQIRFAVLVPDDLREEMAREAAGNVSIAMPAPLQTIDSMLFDLAIDSGIELELAVTADSPENGQKLYDTFNGYVAMGKMFAAQSPEAAAALEALKLEHDGTRVSLTMSLSGEQIWTAFDQAQEAPPAFTQGS